MTTLEQHAVRYRFNGLPMYGHPNEWGDAEIVGVVEEPVWDLATMTPEQQQDFGARFFALLNERDMLGRPVSDAGVYRIVLEENGVTCPHPPGWRTPIGDGRRPGFECGVCLCWIVPAHYVP